MGLKNNGDISMKDLLAKLNHHFDWYYGNRISEFNSRVDTKVALVTKGAFCGKYLKMMPSVDFSSGRGVTIVEDNLRTFSLKSPVEVRTNARYYTKRDQVIRISIPKADAEAIVNNIMLFHNYVTPLFEKAVEEIESNFGKATEKQVGKHFMSAANESFSKEFFRETSEGLELRFYTSLGV